MTVKEIENMLQDDYFVSYAREFRKNHTVILNSLENTKAFFINFLMLETIAEADYSDAELLNTYDIVSKLAETRKEVSTEELPYHPKKKRPIRKIKFRLDMANRRCTMQ